MIKSKSDTRFQVLANAVLIIFAVFIILPFLLLFISSFTEENSLIRNGYSFIPEAWSLEAYKYIFRNSEKIIRAYGITILVTLIGTFAHVTLAMLVAYPLSLEELPGRRAITFFLFFTLLFNGGLVPTYLLYTNFFHVKNTIWALIVPNFLLNAMNILLIRSYITSNVPKEMLEAAKVDGASELLVFLKIIIPLSKPILVTVGTFAGLNYWNDWTNGLYYITKTEHYGIQNLLNKMLTDIRELASSQYAAQAGAEIAKLPTVGVRMAIAVVAILPILIVFPFLEKYFEKGITLGAVKG